jgi:hypothetical protein
MSGHSRGRLWLRALSVACLPALSSAPALAFGHPFIPPASVSTPPPPATSTVVPVLPATDISQSHVGQNRTEATGNMTPYHDGEPASVAPVGVPVIPPSAPGGSPPASASSLRVPIAATAAQGAAEPPAKGATTRPRFCVAIGMGVSVDGSAPGARTVAVPAFEVMGGIGEGMVGFEARLFSSQASGRYQMIPDRLAVDALVALHLLAGHSEDPGWMRRVARGFTVNLGLSGENTSIGQKSVIRTGAVVGAHLDLPLTSPGESSELRLRIGVRRMFGGDGVAGTITVSDTGQEWLASLAAAF